MGFCQKQELKAPQVSVWDRSCPSFMVSATSSSGGDTFPQKSQVSWCGHAKRAAVLFCLVPNPQHVLALSVACSLLFLLFTEDDCDTGGFLQSKR